MPNKKEYRTIGFRVYLYGGFNPAQEARGTIALLDKTGKQVEQLTYNHWDEIPQRMRRLLNKHKKENNYFRRTCWVGDTPVKDV